MRKLGEWLSLTWLLTPRYGRWAKTKRIAKMHKQYEEILHGMPPGIEQDMAFSKLMDRIAMQFDIPPVHDPEWEKQNRSVIAFYRKVAESRTNL